MAVVIQSAGGGGGFGGLFPSEYSKMKSTALGDTFPGWDNDIIPICISVKATKDWTADFEPGQRWYDSPTSSLTINNKTVASADTSIGVYSTARGTVYGGINGNAYSIFLPYFYDFDFNAIKNNKANIESMALSTPTVWLERQAIMTITEVQAKYVFEKLGKGQKVDAVDFKRTQYIALGEKTISTVQKLVDEANTNGTVKFYQIEEGA